ncbi:hypothetical protein QJQ58_13680 [Paenibacillus dendritiformis]|uniref:hypothetical protein n=1 Tax=Paenibacillus dendritiformis TaxID=130049 RepID=UPI00248AE913|nr:hypothetical protein [Paenibacillus dendritiformis]WGU97228.1 hypothetical protein QJQ58_13680 [Paenibacillus dendritiformis]
MRTYRTLKGVSERLRARGIITIRSPRLNDEFFAFCRSNPCLPDFIPLHFYPHDHVEEGASPEPSAPMRLPLHPYRQILEEFMGTLNRPRLRDAA